MSENKKKGRLRIELSRPQKVLLGLVLAVLALGLGYGWYYFKGVKEKGATPKAGINLALPDAVVKTADPADKMAYYELAKKDSVHRDTVGLSIDAGRLGLRTESGDEQTRRINEKLASINQVLAAPSPSSGPGTVGGYRIVGAGSAPMTRDVERLESLMKNMSSSKERDPEMEQLGGVMDKLLALQNPALAGKILGRDENLPPKVPDSMFRAVPAVIAVNQKSRQGSVVELRLLDTLIVSGQVIPEGHLIYGLASFSNQRLNLEIKNIRLGSSIVPVNLTVFDQRDGMAGINAPEAMVRDAVAGGVSSASGGIGITGFDLGTQLAGAGIDAARSLLNKKVARLSQRLKAGYPLLLRDNTVKREKH